MTAPHGLGVVGIGENQRTGQNIIESKNLMRVAKSLTNQPAKMGSHRSMQPSDSRQRNLVRVGRMTVFILCRVLLPVLQTVGKGKP